MESVGHYTILERLGAGTLGELYRARDTRVGRTVALRLVAEKWTSDPAQREAILEAARSTLAWSHPHVAALFDAGEADGQLFLAWEYVPGSPLAALLQGRPFEARTAVRLATQLCDALAAASEHGGVHGALSPSAILVTPADQAKILDFGFARWTETGRARRAASHALNSTVPVSEQTLRGMADTLDRGVSCMSPEQALGEPIDCRSDIFSVGVIVYQLLTGYPPFWGAVASDTALKIVQATPRPPSLVNGSLPPAVDRVVARALSKSLEARYHDAGEMAADLRKVAASLEPVRALGDATDVATPQEHPRGAYGTGSSRRRRRVRRRIMIAAALVSVALVALGAFVWRDAIRVAIHGAPPPPQHPVVVVRPFEVLGSNAGPYFGMGFADDVAARLAEVRNVSVVGRTLTHDQNGAKQEVMNALGSGFTVKGSVRPASFALLVDAQLVDASGTVVWSRSFRRDPTQAIALEAEIAREVAKYFGLDVPSGNRWSRSATRLVDPTAYDLYLQGRDASERRDRSRAIAAFQQALARDARLVEARAQLALALYLEEFYSGVAGDTSSHDAALREAQAALAAEPDLPAAQVASALAAPTMIGAASSLARALALDQSNGEAWHYAGDLVSELDPGRALAYYRASLRFEPMIDANYRDMAAALSEIGSSSEAESSLVRGEVARPTRPWWHQMRARFALERGDPAGALAALGSDPATESSPAVWLMGRIVPLIVTGRPSQAIDELVRVEQRYPTSCEARALRAGALRALGQTTPALTLADDLYTQASQPNAWPSSLACAALAAAGVGSSPDAAGWLVRIASDERALRSWTRQSVFGMAMAYRRGWYPWYNVNASNPVKEANLHLRASLERLQREVTKRLPAAPE